VEIASETIVVKATPSECYAVVTDFESYPLWASDIKAVEVVRRDDSSRPVEVTYRATAFGRSASYTLSYDYTKAPYELSWVLKTGDIVSKLDGSYSLSESEENFTQVTYQLSAELIVPFPGFVMRRAESKIIHAALEDLRQRVESNIAAK
jgi:ribosome-associated toxin RatA of RatAB toxin-antitoxin module